jgi:LysR family transcriptional regulator, regulator of abg operon
MTLQQMIDFLAVADSGSLHAAARATGQTQPALSKSLRRLEQDLGAPLVSRSVKGVRMTECGERFRLHARVVVAEARRAKEAVGQLAGAGGGTVRYGISTAASVLLAPGAVTAFRRLFTQVGLHSRGGLFHTLAPLLREGAIDFAICPAPEEPQAVEFSAATLIRSEMALVARRGHRLARERSLRGLQDAHFVVGAPRGRIGAGIYEAFMSSGLEPPHVDMQTDTPLDTLAMVAATDHLCLVPSVLLRHGFFKDAVVALPVEEPLPVYRVQLFQRLDVPLTPAAAALATMFESEAQRSRKSGSTVPLASTDRASRAS